jgi:predicted transcriptional regulator/transcriptional regulator with XRE-family HTH domain
LNIPVDNRQIPWSTRENSTLHRSIEARGRPMARSLIGPKIRDRRRALGTTQAALAARVEVSASYLNLIEANKRNIGGTLLKRIAAALELSVEQLDGAAERRLLGDLEELAGEPLLAELGLDRASADDLAGRHTRWAHAMVTLHRSWIDRNRAVAALSDRLGQDPFLADAVHGMLTHVSAIRSSSEILETVADLAPAKRERFVAIIGDESRRLAQVAQAMAAFFDRAHSGTRSMTPVEEVDDFLFERGNHFASLEASAEALRARATLETGDEARGLREYLQRVHGVAVRAVARGELPAGAHAQSFYDAASRTLAIAEAAPAASTRFALARLAAELGEPAPAMAAEIASPGPLASDAAKERAARVLSSYVAAAILMPYEAFHAAALACRCDADHLAHRFGASFEQACHRLTTLRRPGREGIAFGLMRVDAAGFVTKRLALPRLLLPRHGNACPLWAVYQAFQSPGAMVRQLAAFPAGDRFLFVARTVEKPRPAFALPPRRYSIMLACDALYADRTVYGGGLDLAPGASAVPVGPNCRLCARRECAYREEAPIFGG